jgi:outer membrane receptor protein involved in Fe transport
MINEPGFSLDRHTFTADGSDVRPFEKGYGYSWHQPGATNTQSGGPEAANAERAFDGGSSGNEVEQQSSFVGFKYQVDADLELFGQTLYGKTSSNTHGVRGNPHLQDSWHGTIYADNAFLPAQVREAMLREGIASFRFDKLGQLLGPGMQNILDDRSTSDTSRMWSVALGFEQDLPRQWAMRGSVQRGKSRVTSAGFNMQRIDKLFLALDAVRDPLTGAIVCNVQLHDPTPAELQAAVAGKLFLTTGPEVYTTVDSPVGPDNVIRDCVPYNPFGHGNASAAADAYISQDKVDHRTLDQDFAELLFTGNLSDEGLGYGPVSFAGGFTWRVQSFLQYSTPQELEREPGSAPELGIRGIAPGIFGASRGLVQFSNNDSRSGEFDVWETFGELNVPLWHNLGATFAYRSSDYSSSGRIESWKFGIDFAVSAELRLRATRSRDVREPTFAEQFVTVGGGGTLDDPYFAGAAVTTTIQSGGNPALQPERANTVTGGFVYQPSWLAGTSLAVDWYEIALFDAVSSLGAQRIVDECFHHRIYCDLVTRDPSTHIIQRVINSSQNVAAARTSGVDIELQYSAEPDFTAAFEQLTLRAFAGYLGENSTTPFAGSRQDAAGTVNRPEWTAVLSASYSSGRYGLRLQQSYYDSTLLNATWLEGRDIDDNTVASQSVTNMALSYNGSTATGISWQTTLNVNNVFDRDPPVVPSISQRGPAQTVSNNYDVFGRRYQLGFSMNF